MNVTRLLRFIMFSSDLSITRLVFGGFKIAFGPLGPLTGRSRDFEFDADLLPAVGNTSLPYAEAPLEEDRSRTGKAGLATLSFTTLRFSAKKDYFRKVETYIPTSLL